MIFIENLFAKLGIPVTSEGVSRYLGSTVWLMTGNMVRMAMGVAVSLVVARYYGPKLYGQFSYVMAIVTFISALCPVGLPNLLRRDSLDPNEDQWVVVGTAFWFILTVSGAAFFLLGALLLLGIGEESQPIYWVLSFLILASPFQVFRVVLESEDQASAVSVAMMSGSLVSMIIKITAVIFNFNIFYIGLAYIIDIIIISFITTIVYIRFSNEKRAFKMDVGKLCAMLSKSWPFMISSVSVFLYMKIDVILLGLLMDDRTVGEYSVVARLSSLPHLIPVVFSAALFSSLMKTKLSSEVLYLKKLQLFFDAMFLVALIVVGLMIALSFYVLPIIIGHEYSQVPQLLSLHCVSNIFVFSGVVRVQYLNIENLQKKQVTCVVIGAVTNIVLNFTLIPFFGVAGAVYATLISYGVSAYGSSLFISDGGKVFEIQTKAFFSIGRFIKNMRR